MIRMIGFSWLGKLLALAAIAGGAGLTVGFWLTVRAETEEILRFEQPEIDLRQSPAIEGDSIDAIALLHNFGKVPVRITNMTPS